MSRFEPRQFSYQGGALPTWLSIALKNIFLLLCRFVSLNFPHAPTVLVDNMSTRVPAGAATDGSALGPLPEVTEVRLVGLGLAGRRPLLLARTKDKELILYQAYQYHSPALAADQLKVR
jgi:hypothetical protein